MHRLAALLIVAAGASATPLATAQPTPPPAPASTAARPGSAAAPPRQPVAPASAPRPRAAQASPAAPTPWRPGTWNPQWRRVDWIDYSLTAVSAVAYWYIWSHVVTQPNERRWEGGVLFDEATRHALASRDLPTREGITQASDTVILGLMAYPLVVDPAIALLRGHPGLAWELAWEAALVHFLHGAVQAGIRAPIGRERPSFYYCTRLGENCQSRWGPNQSFPSGHSSTAFASAAVICTQHLNVGLYGGGAPDLATCGVALAAASFAGVARVLSDDHWSSDVLFGAALGVAFGWGVPTLLHYGWRLRPRRPPSAPATPGPARGVRVAALPMPGPAPGLALLALF